MCSKLGVEIDYMTKKKDSEQFKKEDIVGSILKDLANQFFTVEQKFVIQPPSSGVILECRYEVVW